MVIPRDIFFYHLGRIAPKFDREKVKILKPPYKIYDMYVVFSKRKPGYERLTAEFNRGFLIIIASLFLGFSTVIAAEVDSIKIDGNKDDWTSQSLNSAHP